MIAVDFPAVPVPDLVAFLIGDCMPRRVLDAELAAELAAREIRSFRPLACDEDRADREQQLAVLARANKVPAAYNPRLVIHAGGAR